VPIRYLVIHKSARHHGVSKNLFAFNMLAASLVNWRQFASTPAFWMNALATVSMSWAEAEFEQLDLGDARLNKRARILMERFTAEPTASVPKACQGWGETMAAYRFFDSDSIDWRALMAPHWQKTQQRMAVQPVVLCLQDTTEPDFNCQSTFGLGPLSYEAQRGMYLHRFW